MPDAAALAEVDRPAALFAGVLARTALARSRITRTPHSCWFATRVAAARMRRRSPCT